MSHMNGHIATLLIRIISGFDTLQKRFEYTVLVRYNAFTLCSLNKFIWNSDVNNTSSKHLFSTRRGVNSTDRNGSEIYMEKAKGDGSVQGCNNRS
jgi:hypothetical protein